MSPEFRTVYDWQTESTWIMDGAHRVARVQPPKLCDIVLHPGGPILIAWLTLFWWQYVDNERPGRSVWVPDMLTLDDQDPTCYRMTLRCHNADRSVVSICHVELTYDDSRESYVYSVKTEFEVLPLASWMIHPQGGVEFANVWFKGAVGAAIPYQGATDPRWRWVLYTDVAGCVRRVALNHIQRLETSQIFFPSSGGWLGFFDHADGNPVVELDAQTAKATRAEICAWGHDVHFIRRVCPRTPWRLDLETISLPESTCVLHAGSRFVASYQLYGKSAEQGKELLARSQPLPFAGPDENPARPAYCAGLNTFSEAVQPQKPSSSWVWLPSHRQEMHWEHEHGHQDTHSLHIHNASPRQTYWQAAVGPDFWMGPLPTCSQRLSGWIRTANVSGPGATLSFHYSNYAMETGRQESLPVYKTNALRGTKDWTHLQVVIGPPPAEATRGYIRLILDGTGDAWFDDIILEPLPLQETP